MSLISPNYFWPSMNFDYCEILSDQENIEGARGECKEVKESAKSFPGTTIL